MIGAIIFICALVIIIPIVSFIFKGNKTETNSKTGIMNEVKSLSKIDALISEYQRRNQIIQESISIIEKTNNIETLLLRIEVSREHFNWIIDKKQKGLPIDIRTGEDFNAQLLKAQNEHIIRIANNDLQNHYAKVKTLKTEKGIQNNTLNLIEKLNSYKEKISEFENKEHTLIELDQLIKKLT